MPFYLFSNEYIYTYLKLYEEGCEPLKPCKVKAVHYSSPATFIGGEESVQVHGRADDGYDESIVLARIAESAVLNGIGKMCKITLVALQRALKKCNEAGSYRFLRTWKPPRTRLRLAAGLLALLKFAFWLLMRVPWPLSNYFWDCLYSNT